MTDGRPATLPRVTLVLGGARSGKSRHAETLIRAAGREAVYLATAEALDAEMAERVRHHRAQRDAASGFRWFTVEEPLALVPRLRAEARPGRPVLVDCLTLWVTNLLLGGREVEAEGEALVRCLPDLAGPVVFVANEVGLGIVPDNPLARRFRDEAGRLNQKLAERADRVLFIAAGLPLILKDITVNAAKPLS